MPIKNKFKIHILFEFKNGPWGGGNQFLRSLRSQFIKMGVYEKYISKADVVLFNSHHCLEQVLKLKRKYKNKILVHRVDGPIFKIRNKDLEIDKIIYHFNNLFADGTIFQSNWSRQKNYSLGLKKNKFETTIINAPDNKIFNRRGKIKFSLKRKTRLIATSWSNNWRKGFRMYKYLDENLDFDKYEMTFIGNSPINFKNIKWIKPLPSEKIAKQLKRNDIFITASQKDPCSNSLIEALHCYLPAVALNDGGHPEIVKNGGEMFGGKEDILKEINRVAQNYEQYQKAINLPSMKETAKRYYQSAQRIFDAYQKKSYIPKEINLLQQSEIVLSILYQKIKSKLL